MNKIIQKDCDQSFQKQKFTLPIAPASFFAMTLGLAETGNAWRNAAEIWNLPASVG